MKYGKFSNDYREYIIERPDTPTPWINYISNTQGFCGIISQCAGGFCFYQDPRERRITKYRYNNVPVDRPGRYFYIKNRETGDYWSPAWQPVQKELDSYECCHGQGYTKISTSYHGIHHELLYFVPLDLNTEVWVLKIKNTGDRTQRLSVYSYSEFTLWSEPESRNIQWSLHLPKGWFEEGSVHYRLIEPHPAFDPSMNENYQPERPGFAFMSSNQKVLDYDCSRDSFLGTYRSESNPEGVEAPSLGNSSLQGGVGCAALRSEINLASGQEETVIILLGFAESSEQEREMRKTLYAPGAINREIIKIKNHWKDYLRTYELDSGGSELEGFINVWNPYQCKTTFDWSRYASFYENGEGRGMGTRDSCQDLLAVSSHMSGRAKKRIFEILETTQFETGDCYHQFFPLGGRGDLQGFSDDHLWLIQMVYSYVAETGDLDILEHNAKFADSKKTATVYEHLQASVSYTSRMCGEHGLPLILTADWNDTLHLWMEAEKAESVLVAAFYVYALKQLAALAQTTGRVQDSQNYLKQAETMSQLVNDHCWDGEWYARGFGSKVIGTSENPEAKIFLNAQTWCIIAGIAPPERAKKSMESVQKYLASPEGVKLIWPVFQGYDNAHGLISRYVPGRKENGIFAHANAWAIIAEVLLGRPDVAFNYYKSILPLSRNSQAEVLKTEPYIFCQTIASNDALNTGEGANSWLTGTAAWMYVAVTHYLLGLKPVLKGLEISPSLPQEWDAFKIKRTFRGCEYQLDFQRGEKLKITEEGKDLEGEVIKPDARKKRHLEITYS